MRRSEKIRNKSKIQTQRGVEILSEEGRMVKMGTHTDLEKSEEPERARAQ